MSTKKETKVCICVEVEKLEGINQKIAVLEVIKDTLSRVMNSYHYYAEDEKVYADQGFKESSQIAGERAKAYLYVNEILGTIAEKI